jgi:hypothetical protein
MSLSPVSSSDEDIGGENLWTPVFVEGREWKVCFCSSIIYRNSHSHEEFTQFPGCNTPGLDPHFRG